MKNYWITLLLVIVLAGNALPQAFVHPGGLHTQEDLDRMKTKVAEGAHPWIEGWNALIEDPLAQNTYDASPRANMNLRQAMSKDAHAAYLNAIRWYISGDVSHADCAIRILNEYANTLNQIPSGGTTDIVGLGGIGISELAIAGEIMRISDRWNSVDFSRFKDMMVNYLYPVCHDFLTNHNGRCIDYYWANWDANNIVALIAIGVLCDNQAIFDEGIEYYKNGAGTGSIKHAVPYIHPGDLGQWQESGRDQPHALLGVGLLASACQIAWNQGLDLYGYDDNRLLKGAEYVAKYAVGENVPFTFYNNCQPANHKWPAINGRGQIHDRPVYELVYNHYVVRHGISAPYTQLLAEVMRPERGSNDHLGYGTLTFTLEPSEFPVHPAPPAPTNVTATAGVSKVFVKWDPPAGNTIRGYTIQRATNASGPYETVATWSFNTSAKYTDSNVANGTTYYYKVAGINQSGTGESSTESNAATPSETGVLPGAWVMASVGSGHALSSTYANVGDGTYIVTGGGTSLGGNADNLGYTYTKVTGDATITTRISSLGGTLIKTGLMIRESLEPDAKAVSMTVGDGGWRFARMGIRDTKGGVMSFVYGNTYTWIPAWFRLQRSGDTITAYESSDGVTWFTVGTSTVPMESAVYVGFVTCSGSESATTATTFDNVTVVSEGTVSPAAPEGLMATAGNTQVFLSWNAVSNASSYSIKRASTSGGPYTTVATNLNVTSYTDPNLENGTTYHYVVTAVNIAGESPNSSEVNVAPVLMLPPVPEGVVATAVSATQINLSWEASLSAESYNIKRSETNGGPYITIASPTTTAYSDTGLVTSTTYYYVVSAINEIGETDNSNQVRAIPGQANYWKFDETEGSSAADSWGDNIGTLSSGATFTDGLIDNAVSLNGSSGYVTFPQGVVSQLTDFSVTTWIKLDRVDNWARVLDFGSGTKNYMFITPRNGSNGRLRYAITNGAGEQQINTSATLSTGRWYHLAVTQSGTTAILYLDGVEVGRNTTMTLNPSSLGNTTQNYLGKSQWPDPLLAGQMDDFRIYTEALSASEVADMAFAHLPPAAPKNLSTVAGNNQVVLRWTAAPGGTSYNVKRATAIEGPFEEIANVTSTSYTDITAVNCEKYFYTVSTVNGVGESADSSPSGPSMGSKLSGTLIGTDGSWGNNPGRTREAAVDGNLGTYFDAPANTAWVGYDLSADSMRVITKVRYAPRPDAPNRMIGGHFQGANTADFSDAVTLFTVSTRPTPWVLTEQYISGSKAYRYVRFLSPNGFGNIAELEFYGLIGQAPVFSSDSVAEGTYDSVFHYMTVASNMPEEFTATGLPEGLSIDTCTGIISGIPTVAGTFPVTITATNYYGSATDTVTVVIKKNQTISFSSIPAKHIGDADFALTAFATSGLPITYSSSDTTVATIINGNVHINAVGICIITASQAGDSIYYPAAPVSQSFTVIPLHITVLHKDGDSGRTSNNSIKPHLQVVNNDSIDIPYSELTIRYWFTPENYTGINTWIEYAQIGHNLVSANYIALQDPHAGAFGYVEYGFDTSTGMLTGGSNSGSIQSRLANTDWSNVDETDDHSFQLNSSYAVNDHITLYRNGYLIAGTEPEAVTPELNLTVYSENKNMNTGTNKIHTFLNVSNDGNVPVEYNNLRIRYWFTKDTEAALAYWVDYANLGRSNLSGQFVMLDQSLPGADTYFEMAVDSAVGSLYPLSNTGEIQFRIAKANWSNFDESDDHSYLPKAPYAKNHHITVYYNDALVYGIEPGADKLKTGISQGRSMGSDQTELSEFSVYPNPVSDKLTIRLNSNTENAQITVHSSVGKVLMAKKVSGNLHELDLKVIPQGVYIITVTSTGRSIFRKIVKE